MAPGLDYQQELEKEAKGTGFDPLKESEVSCNLLKVAQTLDKQIEMSEMELRDLLKKLFPGLPSYHLTTVTRIVKKDGKESRLERLSRITGGII